MANEMQQLSEILKQGTQHDQSMAVIEAVKAARFRATCGLIGGSGVCIFRNPKFMILLGGKSSG